MQCCNKHVIIYCGARVSELIRAIRSFISIDCHHHRNYFWRKGSSMDCSGKVPWWKLINGTLFPYRGLWPSMLINVNFSHTRNFVTCLKSKIHWPSKNIFLKGGDAFLLFSLFFFLIFFYKFFLKIFKILPWKWRFRV